MNDWQGGADGIFPRHRRASEVKCCCVFLLKGQRGTNNERTRYKTDEIIERPTNHLPHQTTEIIKNLEALLTSSITQSFSHPPAILINVLITATRGAKRR